MPADLFQVFLFVFHVLNLSREVLIGMALLGVKSDSILPFKVYFSLDILQQIPIASFKVFVFVHVLPILMAYFSEPVHVELANEGGKIIMFEKSRQNRLRELADAFYLERVVRACP